jgi:hypothetical protein
VIEPISVRQRLRPTRYAFAVREGDIEGCLKAVSLNTVIWGGVYNPIVPVSTEEPCRDLLTAFDPDYLVDLTGGHLPEALPRLFEDRLLSEEEILAAQDHRGRPRRRLRLGTSMGRILQHALETERKSHASLGQFAMVSSAPAAWSPYVAFTFGSFGALPDLRVDVAATYKALTRATETPFDPEEERNYGEWLFPLGATAYGLRRHGGFGRLSTHVVYVGDHQLVGDLVEFWNIRATGREVWFLPVAAYRRHAIMVTTLIRRGQHPLNPHVDNHADAQKGRSVTDEQFREVREWARSLEAGMIIFSDWRPRFGASSGPSADDVDVAELEAAGGEEVSFLSDGRMTPVKVIQPRYLDEDSDIGENLWSVEVSVGNPYTTEDFTCQLPRAPGVDRLVRKQVITAEPGAVRVGRSGLVITRGWLREMLHLHPTRTTEVFAEVLENPSGLKAVPSQPGRYADQIIRKMGSLLFGSRLFKVRGVREIVERLSNGSTLTKGNMSDIVRSTTPDRYGTNWRPDLYDQRAVGQGESAPDFTAIFEELLQKRVIRPGLTFRCRNCFAEDWYHVSEFSEDFTCRYCFERQGVSFGSAKEWQYKSDGLFRIPHSAQGSLAVILALWRLRAVDQLHSGRYSTGINLCRSDGSVEYELDYCYLHVDRFRTTYDLVLGEAKGFMDYDASKLQRLAELADRFERKPYLCLATLKDGFTSEERQLLRDLKTRGHRVIALTRLELDPHFLFHRFKTAPHKYAVSLDTLAESSSHMNLGPEETSAPAAPQPGAPGADA